MLIISNFRTLQQSSMPWRSRLCTLLKPNMASSQSKLQSHLTLETIQRLHFNWSIITPVPVHSSEVLSLYFWFIACQISACGPCLHFPFGTHYSMRNASISDSLAIKQNHFIYLQIPFKMEDGLTCLTSLVITKLSHLKRVFEL